jgi:predicted TIM-barrel fold metal-dependent hydrolase
MAPFDSVIDADGHVEECIETFSDPYLDARYRARRPQVVGSENGRAFWVIDDQLFPRLAGRGCHILGTPTGIRSERSEVSTWKPEHIASIEMRDVEQRRSDIKKEDIDLQVVYPTLFIAPQLTADAGLSQALCRSYNNWISEACARRPEAFKWVAAVTLDDVPGAVAELGRAKGMGAIGVTICGTYGERLLGDPDFLPFFAEAARLDLAVGVHVGWTCAGVNNLVTDLFNSTVTAFAFPVLASCVSMIGAGLFDRFPNLRVAYLEAGCEWVPYLTTRMNHFYEFAKERMPRALPPAKRLPEDYFRSGNIYVSCEVEDRLLPYVIDLIGEDHLLFASDITHSDRMVGSVGYLKNRADLKDSAKRKILSENPVRFYKL